MLLFVFTVFLSMTDTDVSLSNYLHGGCSGAVLGGNGINSVEIGRSVVHLVLLLQQKDGEMPVHEYSLRVFSWKYMNSALNPNKISLNCGSLESI